MTTSEVAGLVTVSAAAFSALVTYCKDRARQRREHERAESRHLVLLQAAKLAETHANTAAMWRAGTITNRDADEVIVYGAATAKVRQSARVEKERRDRLARPKEPIYAFGHDDPIGWV